VHREKYFCGGKMKYVKLLLIAAVSLCFINAAKFDKNDSAIKFKEIKLNIHNPLNEARRDVTISIDLSQLKAKYPDFNYKSFLVFSGKKEIPSQTGCSNNSGVPDKILFLINMSPKETETITIKYSQSAIRKREYKKRTDAYLGKKEDYKLVNGYYTGGKFVSIHSDEVPKSHFMHDARYQFEGPGWESDLVDYRFYLDARNRNDIFGKKVHELVMPTIGKHDLVSNSMESYTKMLYWGLDIFKVGESLGIGSISMYADGKVETVSKTDSEICTVADNGPIYSGIYTNYYGWDVNGKKYDLNSLVSITAGSRLTETDLTISGNPENLATGLAKHDNTELLNSNSKGNWQYMGLYGKQSLAGDNDKLGIVVFYKNSDLIKQTADSESYIVVLKPDNGKLKYYFADAWDQELNGIKNKKEFINYMKRVIKDLDNPVEVTIL
jgi:Domain of unknown function (DUF4861)